MLTDGDYSNDLDSVRIYARDREEDRNISVPVTGFSKKFGHQK